ncbi:glycerophosphoryl diester phosphodiesterase [Nannocystis exedens]|uniref:Glycerophosphoryl diester phosphodiesterase n=1 Tax=Nannocystis exedens TaxID=54 RepID=A0A1I2HTN6_9BACT|nr:glycerophosphodiester phosphodiesterase family protein [Nannocystis exedens]PCC73180.1 glycerophosphoryl diester phosphodiesterase [Nannocystis exedens]SFF33249.1 glycerophosphoryl diester phosphodiesterase [Nannocystis exedens]
MRKLLNLLVRVLLTFLAALVLAVVANASCWSSYRAPKVLLAHRGLAQTHPSDGLTRDTCTAERIHPPEHPYLENTLPSMRAAFEAGADIVEFDVHPTTDGQFAVFHDWRLECRTDGTGVTRERPLAYLKTLDIGHGYTADGGRTFPSRGRGVGLMPSLDEVLAAFPDRRFLINIKSNDPGEGDLLADRLLRLPAEQRALLMAYGGDLPIERLRARIPGLRGMSRRTLKDCALGYLALGWSGHVPDACRDTLLLVPVNLGFLLWGWPHRTIERMHAAGTEVFVIGPYGAGEIGTSGIDTLEDLGRLPAGYSGGLWTNRVDRIAPAFIAP